jgi:xylan 1,4-beta-xylosidase
MKSSRFLPILVGLLIITLPLNAQVQTENPFKAGVDTSKPVTYQNPVIPGFYSDPSVVRVEDDYYLVTSTFEYFPGVPVFHSKDLVNWQQIGHAIHRPEQLPDGLNIFAATLRYNDGLFYMITTNTGKEGNFYVTATDPAGPWSDPIWLDVPGIDPDLYFDEDGKVYSIGSDFYLFEIDPKTGDILEAHGQVWATTGGRFAEAPHIYKKDGWYYLLAAEGGTEEAHTITIARSHNITGPYYSNPANPIVTHVNRAGQQLPIQGLGHGDMVEAADGSWWILFHGYRTVIPWSFHHTLGRETCLAPVSWPTNGWPQVNGNGTITTEMRVPTLPLKPFPETPKRTHFDEALGLEWNYVQLPEMENYSLDERPGFLRLMGDETALGDVNITSTFLGRRLQHLSFVASTRLEFNPQMENEEAGLTLLNNGKHFDLVIQREEGKRVVFARFQFENIIHETTKHELADGPVVLKVESTGPNFTFSYSQDGETFTAFESVSARYLSSETIGGFTGVYAGLFATGNGQLSESPADFDWFEYSGE